MYAFSRFMFVMACITLGTGVLVRAMNIQHVTWLVNLTPSAILRFANTMFFMSIAAACLHVAAMKGVPPREEEEEVED